MQRSHSSRFLVVLAVVAMAGGYAAASIVERPAASAPLDAAGGSDTAARPSAPARPPAPSPTGTPAERVASTPSPMAVEPPEPAPDHSELTARLAAVVQRPDLQLDGPVGIAVLDAAGREVFALDADRPLIPASTNKLVTAAGAMLELGPDHRFVTQVVAHVPIRSNGTLSGELTLVGAGDPSLVSEEYHRWIYPSRPWASLDALADDLVAKGLRRIDGSIVGDGTAFTAPTLAPGWKGEYLEDLNARHVTGLTAEAGLDWWIETPPPDVQLEIHLADDPVLGAAQRLQELLEARGVEVSAPPQVATDVRTGGELVLAEVTGPSVAAMLAHTLQRSDNHMADMLFVAIGAAQGRGNWTGGAVAIREHLQRHGIRLGGLLLDDGSGLSRRNRVSAWQLAAIDAVLADSTHGATWSAAMATAGESGTLRGRLRGTIAQGRFHGKTGTLDDVRSLVGHAVDTGGDRYHLAVVANELSGGDRWKAYVLMDELVLALVAELDGCVLVAPSPAPSPSEPYRSATRC